MEKNLKKSSSSRERISDPSESSLTSQFESLKPCFSPSSPDSAYSSMETEKATFSQDSFTSLSQPRTSTSSTNSGSSLSPPSMDYVSRPDHVFLDEEKTTTKTPDEDSITTLGKLPSDFSEIVEHVKNTWILDAEKVNSLAEIIATGFAPARFLRKLRYHETRSSFDEAIYQLRMQRLLFPTTPPEKAKQILDEKLREWFYCPLLSLRLPYVKLPQLPMENRFNLTAKYELTSVGKDVHVLSPWLPLPLFEFCEAGSVKATQNGASGFVGGVETLIEIDPPNLFVSVSCFENESMVKTHAVLLAKTLAYAVEKNKVLKKYLKGVIAKWSKGPYDLSTKEIENTFDTAEKKSFEELCNNTGCYGDAFGNSQDFAGGEDDEDDEENPKVLNSSISQDSGFGNSLNEDSVNDGQPKQKRAKLSSSASSGFNSFDNGARCSIVSLDQAEENNHSPIGTQGAESSSNQVETPTSEMVSRPIFDMRNEDDGQGGDCIDMSLIFKYLSSPSKACIVNEATKGTPMQLQGNATLVSYDTHSKTGIILTAYHVWRKLDIKKAQVCFNCGINRTPKPTHCFPEPALIRFGDVDKTDHALLRVVPLPDITISTDILATPMQLNRSEEFWRCFKNLFAVGFPKTSIGSVEKLRWFKSSYDAKTCKHVAQLIIDSRETVLPEELRNFSTEDLSALLKHSNTQVSLVREPCNNQLDEDDAKYLIEQIVKSAKKNSDSDSKATEVLAQQLRRLLYPKRFLMHKCGMAWGCSGSAVVSPQLPGGDIVGIFLCGFPEPSGGEFKARHFKIMQGAKISAIFPESD